MSSGHGVRFLLWAVLAGMTAVASLLYIDATRSARIERKASAKTLSAMLHHTRKLELGTSKTRSILEALRDDQQEFRSLLARLLGQLQSAISTDASPSEIRDAAPEDELVEMASSEDVAEVVPDAPEALPPVPAGVDPMTLLRRTKDAKALAQDKAFNPTQRELTRAERFRLTAAFVRAKSEIEALDAELRSAIADAVEALRQEGEYIDYAAGERYATDADALTAGEPIEGGGVRISYLYRDRFPKVFERKTRLKTVSEESVRRIAAVLQQPEVKADVPAER